MKVDPDDLITQTDAARIRGVSHQAIAHLIKEGRFQTIKIAGKTFLLRTEVENYKPGVGGRPKKEPSNTTNKPQKRVPGVNGSKPRVRRKR